MKNNTFWRKLKHPSKGGQAILALAPMAGITDSAFRQMCKKYGADVVYSEMASVSALFYKPQKTLKMLQFNAKDRPYVVQLFGNKPEHFAEATKIITKKIRPDGIDINFGCPARKVFGQGSGCALMPQKKLAREIISSVCENTHLPVSIKIRAGLHPIKYPQNGLSASGEQFNGVKNITAIKFIENIKDLPFSAVMVHGRTYEGKFSGKVDFEIVQNLKKIIPDKIVLANGGINTPEEAKKILEDYPTLDGLGIARGSLGRPFIFDEIKSLTKCHPERIRLLAEKPKDLTRLDSSTTLGMTSKYNFSKIKGVALEHSKLVWKEGGKLGMLEMRKHLSWYVRGFPNASELRQKLVQIKTLEEIKNILKNS
jgi:tRNA-dihydrouridine synthase B